MKHRVRVDVVADPVLDACWVDRISQALAQGRTDVPVDLSSQAPFHRKVLHVTTGIPRGEVRTYAELAAAAGRPKAARAVGNAMACNPIPLLVPCHRVVPTGGGVGTYGYGVALKRQLLASEGVII